MASLWNSAVFGNDAQNRLTVNGGTGNTDIFEVNTTDNVVYGGGRYTGDDWGTGTIVKFQRTYNGSNRQHKQTRSYAKKSASLHTSATTTA